MVTGKLYVVPDGDPVFNMASDEWLLKRMVTGGDDSRAVLKLYTWPRPAITLGYNQKFEKAVDPDLLTDTIPVIRRITGGRAIYHDAREITFTFIIDLTLLPEEQRRIRETNRMVSESVVAALSQFGFDSFWSKNGDRNPSQVPCGRLACFESVSRYEIFSGANKIAAGAQRFIGDFLIHQGSLKLEGVSACAAIGQNEREGPLENTDEDVRFKLDGLKTPFENAFGAKFGILFEKCEFSHYEREDIEKFSVSFLENILNRRRIV